MIQILFYMAVICSMLSQLPFILQSGIDSYLKMSWLFPLCYLLLLHCKTFTNNLLIVYYFFLLLFFLYCFVCEGISGEKYIGADLYNICISCIIMSVSFIFWYYYGSDNCIMTISFITLICAFILSLWVYAEYLMNANLLSRTYAFQAKNSMGQILLSSSVIALLYLSKLKSIRITSLVTISIIIIIMFMMKSRATIMGFLFVLCYFIFKYNDIKIRVMTLVGTIMLIGFILINNNVYNNVVNGILLGARNANNLNDLSSGRLVRLLNNLPLLQNNLLLGIGIKYIDCFPFAMILQYGIVGASIIFGFIIKLSNYILLKIDTNNKIHLATFLLFVTYMINSLFEAQTPFGPGAKCFLLWMMLGFSLAEFTIIQYHKFEN